MKRIKEKKERALGTKLFLKAERCSSPKCVMIRRPYKPGQHGQARRRGKLSDFGQQLQEKQKIQIIYGLNNTQMRKIFQQHAGDPRGIAEELETRLDRVVHLLGFAPSGRMARQMVSHGHILVNGRKVTIGSYSVQEGDEITVKPSSLESPLFQDLDNTLKKHETPAWLRLDPAKKIGTRVGAPDEEAIGPFDLNLVGQFYAR